MHSNCCLGERLLNTEAKHVSKIAQMKPNFFLSQTCSRIKYVALLNCFFEITEPFEIDQEIESDTDTKDKVGRCKPNFFDSINLYLLLTEK